MDKQDHRLEDKQGELILGWTYERRMLWISFWGMAKSVRGRVYIIHKTCKKPCLHYTTEIKIKFQCHNAQPVSIQYIKNGPWQCCYSWLNAPLKSFQSSSCPHCVIKLLNPKIFSKWEPLSKLAKFIWTEQLNNFFNSLAYFKLYITNLSDQGKN